MKLILAFLVLSTVVLFPAPGQCDSGFPLAQASPKAVVALNPSAPSSAGLVAVAEPAAPPAWAQDVMVAAQKLPVIGPLVSKALLFLGIIVSILTMLVSFIIGAAAALNGVFNWAGLTKAVVAITDFQNGKIMYWLKFFSMFNAKKPDPQ